MRIALALSVCLLYGCALPPPSPKWAEMEGQLAQAKSERAAARVALTADPAGAASQSETIARLNRKVTQLERSLSFSPTEPVSTEPVEVAVARAEPLRAIKVLEPAWNGLTDAERKQMSSRLSVQVVQATAIGTVMAAQTLNQSTPGSVAGSEAGSTLAQVAYIDRQRSAYTARGQVGAAVVGAVVGSLLNTPSSSWFLTRYSVRTLDGNVQFVDQNRTDPFTLPASMCVQLPDLDYSDQKLCTQTAAELRSLYITGVQ